MRLSKTKVIAGLQCEKQLHLRVHHPEWARPTESPATITGQVVEAHARREFPRGVLVERDRPGSNPFAQTRRLLRDPSVNVIFEAGIRDQDLELFVDVLERDAGGWALTEVKAAAQVRDRHIDDVTIQAVALARAGIPVNRFWLMHVDRDFVYRGGHDYAGLFVREDITERVRHHTAAIEAGLGRFKAVVAGPQPERRTGSHCENPYPCPYRHYCEACDAAYPVGCLPNGEMIAPKLIARGIYDIRDIPWDALGSELQLWVRRVTIDGRPELRPGAAELLARLAYPRYYLDFECIQFAIPIWPGTTPYMQLPFQWSCHVQPDAASLAHKEFLDTSGRDPRRDFAERLIAACGARGPVVVYNQSFEKRVVRELAATFPDLARALLALNQRMFDLWPVLKRHYYHPDMKGSWSLKSVLSCLVPELRYSDLGRVRDGTQAQAAYFDLIGDDLSAIEKEHLRHDLLAYCKLDTYGMAQIVERICRHTESRE